MLLKLYFGEYLNQNNFITRKIYYLKDLVSIIVPVYNREELICETLDSIIMQTYTNWECIIIDDHSTDKTVDVILSYSLNDSRIKIFKV